MSFVVTQSALTMGNMMLSDIEFALKLNMDAQLALMHSSSEANGDPVLMAMYHEMGKQLEYEKTMLEAEYQAIQAQVESWKKLRKEAIKRSFTIDI